MINMEIFGPIIISTLAGLSTVIGGLIIYLKIKKINEFIVFCLSLSLSVMIGISIFELIPSSTYTLINYYGLIKGLILIMLIFIIGSISINFINKYIKNYKTSKKNNNLYRVGLLSMFALMLHNFPEGIATFMSSYKDIYLGIQLSIAIMLHNIPEGISIAVPIYYSTGNKKKGLKYSFISGLAEPLGAVLTYLLFKSFINDITISFVLIFVAGIMITLSINELLPEALKYNKNKQLHIGLIIGIIIVIINHIFF